MKTFTRFKVGDVVEVQQHCRGYWEVLSHDKFTYTIVEVQEDVDPHAYEEGCENSNCLHPYAHPDKLKMEGEELFFSAFWFDPECEKYQPKEEKNA